MMEQGPAGQRSAATEAGWPAWCVACGAGYDVDGGGWPVTAVANICDDCDGYVDDVDPLVVSAELVTVEAANGVRQAAVRLGERASAGVAVAS